MADTPRPFARPWLIAVAFVAIIFVVLLMREAFLPASGVLEQKLPVTAAAGHVIHVEGGEFLTGNGKVRLDDEVISIQRVVITRNEAGREMILPATNGKTTREAPNTFRITARGLDGTTPAEHEEGTLVRSNDSMFFPENNATFGEDVDDLFYLILWITGIAFILSETFLLYSILAFKARPGERSHYSHGHHKLELFWTISIAGILILLAVWQFGIWKQVKQQQPTPEENPVKVQVLGQQFKWFFRHAGNDGEFGTPDDVISGSLRVPKGRKVAIQLRAQDVIHSFFLPNYRVKQDAVPGMTIPVWFESLRTGQYPIMCAELCGLGHTTMGATLQVDEPDEWQAWMEQASAEAAARIEEEEIPRPEWHDPNWWWWDRTEWTLGFVGARPKGD